MSRMFRARKNNELSVDGGGDGNSVSELVEYGHMSRPVVLPRRKVRRLVHGIVLCEIRDLRPNLLNILFRGDLLKF